MRAKELINLLKDIDPEADVLAPVDNKNGLAGDFILTPIYAAYDIAGRGKNDAPHSIDNSDPNNVPNAYLLDCCWTVVFNSQERKRRED